MEQTNLYTDRDCNFAAFLTGREDISSFLGVLLLLGYHHLPEENRHWSNCEDLGVPIVSKAMSKAQVFATSSATFTLWTTTTWSKATKLRRLLQFTPVLTPPLPSLECSTKICRLMNRWCHTFGATVRRCSFVESPSASGTRSGAFPVRTAIRRLQVYKGKEAISRNEPLQRIAPFGSLLSLSFSQLFPTHSGFNNFQLNMMASGPFFYQSVLLDARR